ncbi:toprim domain-containing protein [Pseudomonas sp. MAP12]|uniref:Toprim domain-containing protein n=2 Tax=Geopseudomonas aromaticivorans TaxID=2849492 RepID=A0ABS6MX27_9GAMM|nr:toprim domain-containing protein [Pseudomonas aromaticivorans]
MIAQKLGLSIGGEQPKRDLLEDEIERQRIARQRMERERKAVAAQQAGWERVAARATRLWGLAILPAPAFPYIELKRIKPHHLRQYNDKLVAPICRRGSVVNLQFIAADGMKRFLLGGRINGCYCPFGRIEPGKPLYIVEGIATAATLHEETGHPVAAALSSTNLLPAGQELQRRYPDAKLIIGGDDDRAKEAEGKPNAGKQAAIQAAKALGCGYVLPAWPEGAPLHLSDFNDLRLLKEV